MKTVTTNQAGQIWMEMDASGTNCTKSQAVPSTGISWEHRKPAVIVAAVAPMNQVGQISLEMAVTGTN